MWIAKGSWIKDRVEKIIELSKFVTYLLSKMEQMPISFRFCFSENFPVGIFPPLKGEWTWKFLELRQTWALYWEIIFKKTNMVLIIFVQCRKYRHLYWNQLKPLVRNLILKQLLHKIYLGFPHQWRVAKPKITEIVCGHQQKKFYLQHS